MQTSRRSQNSKWLKIKDNENITKSDTRLSTINGVKKTEGLTKLKIRIFNIEKTINVYVKGKENFQYDFLIGLDIIKEFRLKQDANLQIGQEFNVIDQKEYIKKDIPNKVDLVKRETTKSSINFNERIEKMDYNISEENLTEEEKKKLKS